MPDVAVASFTPADAPPNAAPIHIVPQAPQQTAADGSQDYLALISHYESGNRNIANYRFDPQHTAQGYFQITNSNWSKIAPQLGIDIGQYPTAMSAPRDVQAQVAEHLLTKTPAGIANWSAFNPRLHAALDSSGLQTSGAVTPQGSADRSAAVATSDVAPSAPQAAAPAQSVNGQDLLERLSAGEDIDVTPEMLNRIMLAPPQALQSTAAPAKAPAPVAVAGFTPAPAVPLQGQDAGFLPTLGRDALTLGKQILSIPGELAMHRGVADLTAMGTALTQGREQAWQQMKDAYARGDYKEAFEHLFGSIPILGPPLNQAMNELRAPEPGKPLDATHLNVPGQGWAHAVEGLLPLTGDAIPRVAELPGRIAGAVSETPVGKAAGAVPVFVKGAAQAAPEALKGGLERGAEAIVLGPHAAVMGAKIGIAKELAKGGINAVKEYWNRAAPEAAPAAAEAVPEAAAAPTPLPPSRQLPAPAIAPPPPADTSYVRAVPAQYPEVEPGFTPPAPPPAPQPQLTVEDLGRSLTGGKSPSKWTDAERATIQSIHQRITQGLPEEPPPRSLPPDQAAALFPHVDFGTPAAPSPAAPEAPAAPPPAPEAPPVPEAPAAPAAHPTVQRYTDYLIANGIPGKMVDQFRPQEWELLAPQVNPAAPEVPTAEMATAIRKNIADFESKPTTPAELQAKADTFNAAKAAQTPAQASLGGGGVAAGPAAAATPTPSAAPPSPAEALAQMMPEFAGKPPAGTPTGAQPLSLQDLMRGAQTKETAIQTAAQAYRQANRQGNAIKLAEALYNRGTGSADAAQMAVEDLQKLAQTLDVAKKTKSWDLLKQETVLRLQQLEKTGAVSQRQAFEEARADTMAPNAETGNATVSGTGRQVQAPAQPGNRVKPQTGPAYSGTETSLRIPGESATYPARYVLRELDDIQASHNPHNFQPNPDYALRNDRNYSDPANQERIVLDSQPGKFAPEYLITDSPDAVNGPPVVEPGGNVIGGNSRAMKLARVYANNPADAAAYRTMLEQRAAQFGIDPAQVKTMRRPVLVRELASVAGDPQKLVTDLNKTGTAALTAVERATADARRLSGAAAEYLGREIEAEGPEASLNDALSGKRGAGIVNKLVEEGIFTPQEKPALIDSRTGAVTAAAKERISKMLLGQVFADSDQMMRTPAEIRNKLERVVSPILQSSARPAYNLIPTVREALNLLEYARAHGIPNLSDAMRQEGLFGGEPDFSAEVARMGQFLKDAKPTAVAKAFRRYMANTESGMFGESTPEQAFDDAFAPPPAK